MRKYTKDYLGPIVAGCKSFSDVAKVVTGKNYAHGGMVDFLRKKISSFGIDTRHFPGRRWAKGLKDPKGVARTMDQFVEHFLKKDGPFITTHGLKNKLWGYGLLKNECSCCGNTGEWRGHKLTLQLDHVNGDRMDNRLENLSIKCPNCHSQTDTYSGKKNLRKVAPVEANALEKRRCDE